MAPPTLRQRLVYWLPALLLSPLAGIMAPLLTIPYLDAHAEPRYL